MALATAAYFEERRDWVSCSAALNGYIVLSYRVDADDDHLTRLVEIAEALAGEDDARLSMAIDEAEAHGLIPHAARMRIVLAQRTGDRAQLERARIVLEQLGDRQFLRRLEKVSAALDNDD